jgi:hypothetical protein
MEHLDKIILERYSINIKLHQYHIKDLQVQIFIPKNQQLRRETRVLEYFLKEDIYNDRFK